MSSSAAQGGERQQRAAEEDGACGRRRRRRSCGEEEAGLRGECADARCMDDAAYFIGEAEGARQSGAREVLRRREEAGRRAGDPGAAPSSGASSSGEKRIRERTKAVMATRQQKRKDEEMDPRKAKKRKRRVKPGAAACLRSGADESLAMSLAHGFPRSSKPEASFLSGDRWFLLEGKREMSSSAGASRKRVLVTHGGASSGASSRSLRTKASKEHSLTTFLAEMVERDKTATGQGTEAEWWWQAWKSNGGEEILTQVLRALVREEVLVSCDQIRVVLCASLAYAASGCSTSVANAAMGFFLWVLESVVVSLESNRRGRADLRRVSAPEIDLELCRLFSDVATGIATLVGGSRDFSSVKANMKTLDGVPLIRNAAHAEAVEGFLLAQKDANPNKKSLARGCSKSSTCLDISLAFHCSGAEACVRYCGQVYETLSRSLMHIGRSLDSDDSDGEASTQGDACIDDSCWLRACETLLDFVCVHDTEFRHTGALPPFSAAEVVYDSTVFKMLQYYRHRTNEFGDKAARPYCGSIVLNTPLVERMVCWTLAKPMRFDGILLLLKESFDLNSWNQSETLDSQLSTSLFEAAVKLLMVILNKCEENSFLASHLKEQIPAVQWFQGLVRMSLLHGRDTHAYVHDCLLVLFRSASLFPCISDELDEDLVLELVNVSDLSSPLHEALANGLLSDEVEWSLARELCMNSLQEDSCVPLNLPVKSILFVHAIQHGRNQPHRRLARGGKDDVLSIFFFKGVVRSLVPGKGEASRKPLGAFPRELVSLLSSTFEATLSESTREDLLGSLIRVLSTAPAAVVVLGVLRTVSNILESWLFTGGEGVSDGVGGFLASSRRAPAGFPLARPIPVKLKSHVLEIPEGLVDELCKRALAITDQAFAGTTKLSSGGGTSGMLDLQDEAFRILCMLFYLRCSSLEPPSALGGSMNLGFVIPALQFSLDRVRESSLSLRDRKLIVEQWTTGWRFWARRQSDQEHWQSVASMSRASLEAFETALADEKLKQACNGASYRSFLAETLCYWTRALDSFALSLTNSALEKDSRCPVGILWNFGKRIPGLPQECLVSFVSQCSSSSGKSAKATRAKLVESDAACVPQKLDGLPEACGGDSMLHMAVLEYMRIAPRPNLCIEETMRLLHRTIVVCTKTAQLQATSSLSKLGLSMASLYVRYDSRNLVAAVAESALKSMSKVEDIRVLPVVTLARLDMLAGYLEALVECMDSEPSKFHNSYACVENTLAQGRAWVRDLIASLDGISDKPRIVSHGLRKFTQVAQCLAIKVSETPSTTAFTTVLEILGAVLTDMPAVGIEVTRGFCDTVISRFLSASDPCDLTISVLEPMLQCDSCTETLSDSMACIDADRLLTQPLRVAPLVELLRAHADINTTLTFVTSTLRAVLDGAELSDEEHVFPVVSACVGCLNDLALGITSPHAQPGESTRTRRAKGAGGPVDEAVSARSGSKNRFRSGSFSSQMDTGDKGNLGRPHDSGSELRGSDDDEDDDGDDAEDDEDHDIGSFVIGGSGWKNIGWNPQRNFLSSASGNRKHGEAGAAIEKTEDGSCEPKSDVSDLSSRHEISGSDEENEGELADMIQVTQRMKDIARCDGDENAEDILGKRRKKRRSNRKVVMKSNNTQCTFLVTGDSYEDQHWYHCITCNLVNEKGCCGVCVKKCHESHEITYARRSRFFCDCGAGSSCKAKTVAEEPIRDSDGDRDDLSADRPSWCLDKVVEQVAGTESDTPSEMSRDLLAAFTTFEVHPLLEQAHMWLTKYSEGRSRSHGPLPAFKESSITAEGVFQRTERVAHPTSEGILAADGNGHIFVAEGGTIRCMSAGALLCRGARNAKGRPYGTTPEEQVPDCAIVPLYRMTLNFVVLQIEFNPWQDSFLALVGDSRCLVLTLSERGSVLSKTQVELALNVSDGGLAVKSGKIIRVQWVARSQSHLLVVTTAWIKIFDLAVDHLSPVKYYEYEDSIRNFACVDGVLSPILIVLLESNVLVRQPVDFSGEAHDSHSVLNLPRDSTCEGFVESLHIPATSRGSNKLIVSWLSGHSYCFSLSEGFQRIVSHCQLRHREDRSHLSCKYWWDWWSTDMEKMVTLGLSADGIVVVSLEDRGEEGAIRYFDLCAATGNRRIVGVCSWPPASSQDDGIISSHIGDGGPSYFGSLPSGALLSSKRAAKYLAGDISYSTRMEPSSLLVLYDNGQLGRYEEVGPGFDWQAKLFSTAEALQHVGCGNEADAIGVPEPVFFESVLPVSGNRLLSSSFSWGGSVLKSAGSAQRAMSQWQFSDEDQVNASSGKEDFHICAQLSCPDYSLVALRIQVLRKGPKKSVCRVVLHPFRREIVVPVSDSRWIDIPLTPMEALVSLADRTINVTLPATRKGQSGVFIDCVEAYAMSNASRAWASFVSPAIDLVRDVLRNGRVAESRDQVARAIGSARGALTALLSASEGEAECSGEFVGEVERAAALRVLSQKEPSYLSSVSLLRIVTRSSLAGGAEFKRRLIWLCLSEFDSAVSRDLPLSRLDVYYDFVHYVVSEESLSFLLWLTSRGPGGAEAFILRMIKSTLSRLLCSLATYHKLSQAVLLRMHRIVDHSVRIAFRTCQLSWDEDQSAFPGAFVQVVTHYLGDSHPVIRNLVLQAVGEVLDQAAQPSGVGAVRVRGGRSSDASGRDPPAACESIEYRCDVCDAFPLKRVRWHCASCEDFDLCDGCKGKHHGKHKQSHDLVGYPIREGRMDFVLLVAKELVSVFMERVDDGSPSSLELVASLTKLLCRVPPKSETLESICMKAVPILRSIASPGDFSTRWLSRQSRLSKDSFLILYLVGLRALMRTSPATSQGAQGSGCLGDLRNSLARFLLHLKALPREVWSETSVVRDKSLLKPVVSLSNNWTGAQVRFWGFFFRTSEIVVARQDLPSLFKSTQGSPRNVLVNILRNALGLLKRVISMERASKRVASAFTEDREVLETLIVFAHESEFAFASRRANDVLDFISGESPAFGWLRSTARFSRAIGKAKALLAKCALATGEGKEHQGCFLGCGIMPTSLPPEIHYEDVCDVVLALKDLLTHVLVHQSDWWRFCSSADGCRSFAVLFSLIPLVPQESSTVVLMLLLLALPPVAETVKKGAVESSFANELAMLLLRAEQYSDTNALSLLVDCLLLKGRNATARLYSACIWRRLWLVLDSSRSGADKPIAQAKAFMLELTIRRSQQVALPGVYGTEMLGLLRAFIDEEASELCSSQPELFLPIWDRALLILPKLIGHAARGPSKFTAHHMSSLLAYEADPEGLGGVMSPKRPLGLGARILPPYSVDGESAVDCLSCRLPERLFKPMPLKQAKSDVRFTATSMIVSLDCMYTINSVSVEISSQFKGVGPGVSGILVYCNSTPTLDLAALEGRRSLWRKIGALQIRANRTSSKQTMELHIPVSCCNLKFEYETTPELAFSQSSERQTCPRCASVVTDRSGVCRCGEIVYQCRSCRRINQEDRNAFLCVDCGYCRYAKFEYTLGAMVSTDYPSIACEQDAVLATRHYESLEETAAGIREKLVSVSSTQIVKGAKLWQTLGSSGPCGEVVVDGVRRGDRLSSRALADSAEVTTGSSKAFQGAESLDDATSRTGRDQFASSTTVPRAKLRRKHSEKAALAVRGTERMMLCLDEVGAVETSLEHLRKKTDSKGPDDASEVLDSAAPSRPNSSSGGGGGRGFGGPGKNRGKKRASPGLPRAMEFSVSGSSNLASAGVQQLITESRGLFSRSQRQGPGEPGAGVLDSFSTREIGGSRRSIIEILSRLKNHFKKETGSAAAPSADQEENGKGKVAKEKNGKDRDSSSVLKQQAGQTLGGLNGRVLSIRNVEIPQYLRGLPQSYSNPAQAYYEKFLVTRHAMENIHEQLVRYNESSRRAVLPQRADVSKLPGLKHGASSDPSIEVSPPCARCFTCTEEMLTNLFFLLKSFLFNKGFVAKVGKKALSRVVGILFERRICVRGGKLDVIGVMLVRLATLDPDLCALILEQSRSLILDAIGRPHSLVPGNWARGAVMLLTELVLCRSDSEVHVCLKATRVLNETMSTIVASATVSDEREIVEGIVVPLIRCQVHLCQSQQSQASQHRDDVLRSMTRCFLHLEGGRGLSWVTLHQARSAAVILRFFRQVRQKAKNAPRSEKRPRVDIAGGAGKGFGRVDWLAYSLVGHPSKKIRDEVALLIRTSFSSSRFAREGKWSRSAKLPPSSRKSPSKVARRTTGPQSGEDVLHGVLDLLDSCAHLLDLLYARSSLDKLESLSTHHPPEELFQVFNDLLSFAGPDGFSFLLGRGFAPLACRILESEAIRLGKLEERLLCANTCLSWSHVGLKSELSWTGHVSGLLSRVVQSRSGMRLLASSGCYLGLIQAQIRLDSLAMVKGRTLQDALRILHKLTGSLESLGHEASSAEGALRGARLPLSDSWFCLGLEQVGSLLAQLVAELAKKCTGEHGDTSGARRYASLKWIRSLMEEVSNALHPVHELPNIFILMNRVRSQDEFFSRNLENNPLSIDEIPLDEGRNEDSGSTAGSSRDLGVSGSDSPGASSFTAASVGTPGTSSRRSPIFAAESEGDSREPTMRDLRAKIAVDLHFTEAKSILELLVANKIVNLDLPIRLVYEQIWLPYVSQREGIEERNLQQQSRRGLLFHTQGESDEDDGFYCDDEYEEQEEADDDDDDDDDGDDDDMMGEGKERGGEGTGSGDREMESEDEEEDEAEQAPGAAGQAVSFDLDAAGGLTFSDGDADDEEDDVEMGGEGANKYPMEVTYRLQGVDGEATEDIVQSLTDHRKAEKSKMSAEARFSLSIHFAAGLSGAEGGLAAILKFIEICRRDLSLASPFVKDALGNAVTLLELCCSCEANQKLLLGQLNALPILLQALSVSFREASMAKVAEQLVLILEILVSRLDAGGTSGDVASPGLEATSVDAACLGHLEEFLTYLDRKDHIAVLRGSPRLLRAMTKLLPFLTFGRRESIMLLLGRFRQVLAVDKLSLLDAGECDAAWDEEERFQLDCILWSLDGMRLDSGSFAIRKVALETGFTKNIAEYFSAGWEFLRQKHQQRVSMPKEEDDKQRLANILQCRIEFAKIPSTSIILRLLTGLCKGIPEGVSFLMANRILDVAFELEQIPSGEVALVGEYADNLLQVARGGDDMKVREYLENIKVRRDNLKKKILMARRQALVANIGKSGQAGSKAKKRKKGPDGSLAASAKSLKVGDVPQTRQPSWMAEMDSLQDDAGPICTVCQEGFSYKPEQLMGVYVYSKPVSIGANVPYLALDNTICPNIDTSALSLSKDEYPSQWWAEPLRSLLAEKHPSLLDALWSMDGGGVSSSGSFLSTPNSEANQHGKRKALAATTVTCFNCIHASCHENAVRHDKCHPKAPKEEWEGALLRNAQTKCNNLLPMKGPDSVSRVLFENAVEKYLRVQKGRSSSSSFSSTSTSSIGNSSPIAFSATLLDLRVLLLRFAYGESLSEDTHGGGQESNFKLVYLLIGLALHTFSGTSTYQQELLFSIHRSFLARSFALLCREQSLTLGEVPVADGASSLGEKGGERPRPTSRKPKSTTGSSSKQRSRSESGAKREDESVVQPHQLDFLMCALLSLFFLKYDEWKSVRLLYLRGIQDYVSFMQQRIHSGEIPCASSGAIKVGSPDDAATDTGSVFARYRAALIAYGLVEEIFKESQSGLQAWVDDHLMNCSKASDLYDAFSKRLWSASDASSLLNESGLGDDMCIRYFREYISRE